MTVTSALFALLIALLPAFAKGGEVAEAEAARKKPLQRCDQLSDKAEIECLQKARERIVDARRKRETAGKGASNPTPRAETRPLHQRKNSHTPTEPASYSAPTVSLRRH